MATKKTTVTTTEEDEAQPAPTTYGLTKSSTVPEIMAVLQTIIDTAKADGDRPLDDGEVEAYERIEVQLNAAQKTAELYARQEARRAYVPDSLPNIIKPQAKGEQQEYAAAFNAYMRTGYANSDMQRFAQTEGTPSQGGYAVPTEFTNRLIERRVAYGGLLNAAAQITTPDGRPLDWAVTVDDTLATKADIVAEGASSAVGADIAFDTVALGAYRYAATGTGNIPIKVSVELAQDATFDVGAFVAKSLGNRIRRKQAYDLINASGSGAPKGIMYGTSGTIESDIADMEDLNNIIHALDPEYRSGASWIFNDTTAALIENILDANDRPLLVSALQGITDGIARPRLLGYPVIIDQACPDMNTNDVIGVAFGDWTEAYIVRHVKDVQVLVNPYAVAGYIVYDAWARMDGTVQNAWAYVTGEGV